MSQSHFDILSFAELGLINGSDKYGKLYHFQEFMTELENVFQGPALTAQEL